MEDLEQLEAKIEQLLESHEQIRKAKEQIEKELQKKESELQVQVRLRERERSEIRQGLEKILQHITRLDLP